MPELPEVETVARLIRPRVLGRTITSSQASWVRSLGGPTAATFERLVRGATVTHVGRRAKYIVLTLRRGGTGDAGADAGALLVHLRMTGRLHVEPSAAPLGPYTRVALGLDDGHTLRFDDVRKFGRFTHVADPLATLAHLGPEPLEPAFTGAWLHAALRARRRALKPLLLDQEFVAGLGNIYVDEALHEAQLHPLQSSERVTKPQAARLAEAIRAILDEAIAREGSSFDTFYRTPEGQPGSYQHQFRVYGRDGKPCRRCEATVQKLVVGQRGTHVCPRCQRAPRGPRP
ncbi:MAG: bifunctional DNA-formamidopyrimidine glycosylase/DNA-(apurinic or apyrimidinic site) lyase [Polyangiales bacterium]|nr:bifunctional DNA-formamidopyrimidine glycosylase/DNA-(apurinic or apyrimidinic site) lyase [Myxococcales bacterium]MCB9656116.1 bifunctional DNA-formamidopyrimidine glycosylase/DNA-(apurinic or apyrimidinic site) lyase [Sandaracinaceae bacterium]